MNFLNQESKNFRVPSARFFSIVLWAPSLQAATPSTLSWIRPCLQENHSLCATVVAFTVCFLHPLRILEAHQMSGRPVEVIMRLRIELIPESTVYKISDWLHATFREFSLKLQNRYERNRFGTF